MACPGCGYNLRGLTTAHCPECRRAIELRVGLTEPRLGMYLAGVTGLLGGAALAAIFLFVVVLISIIDKGWPTGREAIPLLWVPAAMTTVESFFAAMALRTRSRVWFRGLTRGGRTRAVMGCWLLTAGFVALFVVLLLRLVW